MHIGRIKLVAQFQLLLVADIATTRPRNSTLGKILLLPSCGGCVRHHPYSIGKKTALLDWTRCHDSL